MATSKLILKYPDSGYKLYDEYKIVLSSKIKDTGLTVPMEGNFMQVAHDFDPLLASQFELKPRQYAPAYEQMRPMPATRQMWACQKLRTSDFIPLAKEWQFFLYELFDWATDFKLPSGSIYDIGTLKWVYMDFVANHRAFTDGHAPENGFADYVLGRNLSNPKPYMFKCLLTTGNIVRVIENPSSITDAQASVNYTIEALDLSKAPPKISWLVENKPYLIHWATEQGVVKLPDKRFVVARFPQLKVAARKYNLPEVGTPYPVVSLGGWNLVRKGHLKKVENGSRYSPYVIEKW